MKNALCDPNCLGTTHTLNVAGIYSESQHEFAGIGDAQPILQLSVRDFVHRISKIKMLQGDWRIVFS